MQLERAENLYQNGNVDSIPKLILPCLQSFGAFNDEEKTRAYKLLILSYIFQDNQQLATEQMLKFLKFKPDYRLTDADPLEFEDLYNEFRTTPIISVGVSVGINSVFVKVLSNYYLFDKTNVSQNYATKYGYSIGIKANRLLFKNNELDFECSLRQSSYTFNCNYYQFTQVSMTENMMFLDLPLSVVHIFGKKTFAPFIQIGAAFSYLVGDNASLLRSYFDGVHTDITGSAINVISQRNQFYYQPFVAAGIKYKVGRGNLYANIKYNFGLANFVNGGSRYNNSELIFKYFYVDNDFKINTFSFNVGYLFSFYKPVKLKSKD